LALAAQLQHVQGQQAQLLHVQGKQGICFSFGNDFQAQRLLWWDCTVRLR
jgi:hypothetical protein